MDLIFFGIQGSGKGTLGKTVAAKYGMQIFETGAELRKLSQEDSDLGRKIKSIGTSARNDLEKITGQRIFLDLEVRINPRWVEQL